jgi:TfoX/Sxy family transcriptional regulator of competence genes
MAYDEGLMTRVRDLVAGRPDVTEKKMFGGICLLSRGNMVAGIIDDRLMARVGPAQYDEALGRPHAGVMDFTHRPMRGMVTVQPEGFESDEDLAAWLGLCFAFVDTLPPK